ncbi:MAG: hypothetical protein DMF82_22310 [Acidobacteria bacterium]|nr:MAG: hypothetical protein DMF82_22310 [Acidobacteriota bacterium]
MNSAVSATYASAATAAVRASRTGARRIRARQAVQPAARSTASASTTRIEKRDGARRCCSPGRCGSTAKGSGRPTSRPATRSDGPRLSTNAHPPRRIQKPSPRRTRRSTSAAAPAARRT